MFTHQMIKVATRTEMEIRASQLILAIRERTPAFVLVNFTEVGGIESIRVEGAHGFEPFDYSLIDFLNAARVWCAAHPAPGAVWI